MLRRAFVKFTQFLMFKSPFTKLYISFPQVTELPFFATKVKLGRGGVEEIFPLGTLNEFERFVAITG